MKAGAGTAQAGTGRAGGMLPDQGAVVSGQQGEGSSACMPLPTEHCPPGKQLRGEAGAAPGTARGPLHLGKVPWLWLPCGAIGRAASFEAEALEQIKSPETSSLLNAT